MHEHLRPQFRRLRRRCSALEHRPYDRESEEINALERTEVPRRLIFGANDSLPRRGHLMRFLRCACLLLPVTAAFAVAPLHSQTPPPNPAATAPTMKVETRVVLADVVVTNNKGETIPALRQEDFQIAEDGKPQAISAFDFNQAIKFLATVPPGTRLAIFTLNDQQLRLVRGFATDFSGLSGALDRASWLNPTPSRHAAEMEGLKAMIMMQASPAALDAVKVYLGEETAFRTGARSDLTLQAFQHLARYLSGIPARKNVIWLADTFPISFVPEDKVHTPKHQEHVQQTSDMLTAAQVAIYPVSARGLLGPFQLGDLGDNREEIFNALSSAQVAAETLAQETGGRAFYDTNGLDAAMAKAIDEGSHYYTLAYSPTNTKNDGKYRSIKVKIPDGDYKISYRRGYYADKPEAGQTSERSANDPLIPLVGFGMPNFEQITYQIQASPVHPQPAPDAPRAGLNREIKAPLTRYGVDIAVSLKEFALETTPDGVRHGRLEAMLVAYDRDGKIVNISKRTSRFAVRPLVYAEVQSKGLPLYLEIDVPPGDVYLRTGIYDWRSGNAGTLGLPLSTAMAGPAQTK